MISNPFIDTFNYYIELKFVNVNQLTYPYYCRDLFN